MDLLEHLVVGLCTVDVLVVGHLVLVVVLCIEDGLELELCLVVVRLDRLDHLDPFFQVLFLHYVDRVGFSELIMALAKRSYPFYLFALKSNYWLLLHQHV